ncbi:MAG: flagellar hook assembly protein FlgD [Proteobacteria bacterium]|nr:flagellar hook assembly protein FlgD [Pseudomonadota bacterium]
MSTSLAATQTAGGTNKTNASSMGSASSTAAQATFGKNFDTFLKLLTAQLQNQDPLSPMDSTQFTSQLVQFSSVEQAIRQNTNLETLISMQQNTQSANAVNYIGKTVEMTGDKVGLYGGQGTITYTLPEDASRVIVSVYNKDGQLVAHQDGETSSGDHFLTWNGYSDTGTKLADGDYTVNVSAMNANGGAITTTNKVIGKVTQVDYASGTVLLTVNGNKLPLSQLSTVRGDSTLGT